MRWGRGRHRLALGLWCGLACCPAFVGCDRGFFQASGYVASAGGRLGVWYATPDACSRDPFDGRAIGETASLATFLWEDPSIHDPLRDQHRAKAPDAPRRMDVARAGTGYSVVLATVKTEGTRIDPADCAVLRVTTWEQAPQVKGARNSLAGQLQMDCEVDGGHVTADLRFSRCEF